jgi:hypothetical protein
VARAQSVEWDGIASQTGTLPGGSGLVHLALMAAINPSSVSVAMLCGWAAYWPLGWACSFSAWWLVSGLVYWFAWGLLFSAAFLLCDDGEPRNESVSIEGPA